MIPFPSSTEVCIVGAGPSGLACALGLAARQIPFVIVDALEQGHNSSRAVLLQASALEALGALSPELSAELVSDGIQSKTWLATDPQDRPVFHLRMADLERHTKYAFFLLNPQHRVEHRMREYVQRGGNPIHWHKRVSSVREVAESAQYELQFESGDVLRARYIVAADGSKSFLRTVAGIPFIDPHTKKAAGPGPNDLSFVVADIVFEEPLPSNVPRDTLKMIVGTNGFILTAPIRDSSPSAGGNPAQNLFRVYFGVPDTPPRSPDAAYLQEILDTQGPGSHSALHAVAKIAKVLDSARYRTRMALVDKYVHRAQGGAYILLVGDAAHKHGPAGGQGMNMGICDGCELAQAIDEHRSAALTAEERGTRHDTVEILEAYSTRRRAVAREVMDMVERMTEVENGGAGWGPYFLLTALWFFFKMPFVNSWAACKISGLGHAKRT
ncbi:FAD/NAD(P)-binding domain-containing protein [Mycena maculata]|uniref:FAD/NAD(P)-binding domain-containing protein n=1 Tax=Mycena maculata TaxID=230809 RepID=A0AAD7N3T5_9AGAR|nr:FAD/NAD(P)-binding domain-containing protein [Mycena maculata]